MGRLNTKLASRNENKLRELARVLGDWRLELLDADGYPPEEGATYYENALAKARHGVKFVDEGWVLGEDSGLEVEGLGGGPGIRSARFGGGDPVGRLLGELRDIEGEGRRARYVCELVALSPSGEELRGTGVLEGRIVRPGGRDAHCRRARKRLEARQLAPRAGGAGSPTPGRRPRLAPLLAVRLGTS